jgi:Domain of unknown function (DUF4389)
MKLGKIVLVVFGALLAVGGVLLVAGGAGVTWAYATQRDNDGYFTTSSQRFQTNTAALHSRQTDFGSDDRPRDWFVDDLATLRISGGRVDGGAVFIGVARRADVETYLQRIAHDEVRDVDFGEDQVTYRRDAGAVTSAPAPTEETFWIASVSGSGNQQLVWDVQSGRWSIVVMNADGSPGVATDLNVGLKLNFLVPLMVALFAGGAFALALGVVMIVLGVRHRKADAHAPSVLAAPTPGRSVYPLQLAGRLDEPLSQWKWLVKWLLAIPHFIVLSILWIAFAFLTLVAGVSILFTGRYPRSIFDFNVGVLRWTWRVSFYATSALATDTYPPFTLKPVDYPATLEVAYPEQLSRGLVLVKWWLLAIPHYVIVGLLAGGGFWAGGREVWTVGSFGGGLMGILSVVAGVTLLFRHRYPGPVFDLLMGLNRWVYRVIAYAALMTDTYPPFRLDSGPDEPAEPDDDPPAPQDPRAAPAPEPSSVTSAPGA